MRALPLVQHHWSGGWEDGSRNHEEETVLARSAKAEASPSRAPTSEHANDMKDAESLPCYTFGSFCLVLGRACVACAVVLGLAGRMRRDMESEGLSILSLLMLAGLRWTLVLGAFTISLLSVLRFHFDNGGLVPINGRIYVRRWALPDERTAGLLRPILAQICVSAVGEPHASLHDHRALARDKIVLLVFDRTKPGTLSPHLPCMFHVGFKAAYYREIVYHTGGPLVVLPSHQGRRLQRLSILSAAMTFLTLRTPAFVVTDLSASPTGLDILSDFVWDFFPSRRFINAKVCGGGPKAWQVDVARFMMANHRGGLGASPEAVLDEDTFGVSERPSGAASAVFQVGRCNIFHLVGRGLLISSHSLRVAYVAVLMLWTAVDLLALALVKRFDLMYGAAKNTLYWMGLDVRLVGSSCADLDSLPHKTGTLWVSNHFTLFDYTVMHLCSRRVLRTIVRADIAKEMPILGPMTERFLFGHMQCVPYLRGSKDSGAQVKRALRKALVDEGASVLIFPEGTGTESGPPLPFKRGALLSAYAMSVHVQPVTLWYSESIGLSPTADTLQQLSRMVRFPMQCVLKLGPLVFPADFESAEAFAVAVEARINADFETLRREGGEGRTWV